MFFCLNFILAQSLTFVQIAKKMEMIRIRPNSPALFAVYTDRDTFLVSYGGYDSGYLYECAFDQEDPLYV